MSKRETANFEINGEEANKENIPIRANRFVYNPHKENKNNPYSITGFFPSYVDRAGSLKNSIEDSYSSNDDTNSSSFDVQIQLPPVS
ncbi:uncharacterized protein RJT20DRAFT_128722 [Scheffersomyces xylosifermentans]|uniref:uncharacterized protein n=1 Tax=Scheffersomyces xylosifermentans TaxID=1304137 RepID=UPI00315CB1CA